MKEENQECHSVSWAGSHRLFWLPTMKLHGDTLTPSSSQQLPAIPAEAGWGETTPASFPDVTVPPSAFLASPDR